MAVLEFEFAAIVLLGLISAIHMEAFMSSTSQALADLQAAVTTLQGQVSTLTTADQALDAAIAALEAQLAAGSISPAAIEAVVAQLKTASDSIGSVVTDVQAQTATAQAAVNPPTTPAA